MKVYEYAGCSTCKKALKFLDSKKVAYEKIAIVDQPPSLAELKKMLAYYDGQIGKLFNTSGQLYREMEIGKKLPKMSEEEALKLLSKHGKMVKRPFVLTAKAGRVGFKEDEWKKLISKS